MRHVLIAIAMLVFLVVALAGFRGDISRKPPLEIFPDMDRQPKLRPLEPNNFFENKMSSQPLVAGTIPRSQPLATAKDGDVFAFEGGHKVNTGFEIADGQTNYLAAIPLPVTKAFVQRGQERFKIYCTPCHGGQGLGESTGIVGANEGGGFGGIKSLHSDVALKLADGKLFDVISNGQNAMKGYASTLSVRDRWAVVGYVRALQLSRLGRESEVPERFHVKPAPKPIAKPEPKSK